MKNKLFRKLGMRLGMEMQPIMPPDYIATPATLLSIISGMSDGEVIGLSDGTYTDLEISYTASNARIYAINPGKVTFDGSSRVNFTGTNSALEGVIFNGSNGYYEISFDTAIECEVRRCKFVNCGVDAYSYRPILRFINGASNCVVHHIEMSGNDAIGVGVVVNDGQTLPTGNVIRHSYFHDVLTDSGKEVIQIGQGDRADESTNTTVEYNIFDNCDGDPEAISVKTGGNTIRDNLILDSDGYIVLRKGDGNSVLRNCVSGCTVGIRVHGLNHTIEGNLLVNNTVGISIPAGASTYTDSGALHKAASGCDIDDNVIISNTTAYDFDAWYDGATYDTYPSSITLDGNLTSKSTAQTLIDSVQDVFTWTNNNFADLDWVLSSSPDASKFTLIDDSSDYYDEAFSLYSLISRTAYESAVTTYGTTVESVMTGPVGPNF